MKKLISSTLALTMLATPLINSACFADTAQEPNVHYVQNENRSEPFKEKKCDSQKTRKILAGVAAGTIALTGVTAATLKQFEDKLPENLKSKLPFLFTKKTQETKENIENEKTSETATEDETIETVAAAVNHGINKNETTIETIAAEPNITNKETTGSVAVNSNTTKNETADIEAIKVKIIQSLAKNNTTNNTNDTNWLSTMKSTLENTGNSAKDPSPLELAIAKYIACGLVVAAGSTLLFFAGHRAQMAFANLFNKQSTNAAKNAVRRTAKRITY